MNESTRKLSEVRQIRHRIAEAIGCGTCALGIALDIVEARWGGGAHETWSCGRDDCAAAKNGLTPEQTAIVKALADELMGGSAAQAAPAEAAADPRLPPEKDDEQKPPF